MIGAVSLNLTHSTIAGGPEVGEPAVDRSPGTLAEAVALHAIEGNPLDADDTALFEMFERENWSPERRRAYIIAAGKEALPTGE